MHVSVEPLTEGAGPDIVVVDFAQFSDDGTVAETLAQAAHGSRIHLADPVDSSAGTAADLHLADLAQAYGNELARRAIQPALVVGYCSAAALSLLLVQYLLGAGQDPVTALVEPAWLTDEHLSADLRRVRAGLGATGDPPEVSRTAVLRTLESDLVGKLRADGVPEEDLELCTTMLLERYESWFGFLFTTRHTRVPVPDFPLTVVAGADSPAGGPPGAPPGRTTVVRLPIERAAVPRSPLTAAALLDLVVPTR